MFDLAGLVIGAVALGTVLTTMVHAVQILERAKSQHKDLEYFEVMIWMQGLRLYSWAKVYQPLAKSLKGDPVLKNHDDAISRALQNIQSHITDSLVLFEKHGFMSTSKSATTFLGSDPSQMLIDYHESSQDLITRSFDRPAPAIPPRPAMKTSKRQNLLVKFHLRTAWAVSDSIALEETVTRITKIIDSLVGILPGLKARAQELGEAREAQEARERAARQPRPSRWRRFRKRLAGYNEQPTLPPPPPPPTRALAIPSSSDVSSIIEVNNVVRY